MYQVNRKESVCFRSSAFRFFYIFSAGRGGGGHATVLQRFEDGTLSYIEPQAFDSLQGARRSIDELCEKGAATPFYKRGVMRVDNKLFDTDFLSLFDK